MAADEERVQRRADLIASIQEHTEEQQRRLEERDAATRAPMEERFRRDAALYGTAAWDALPAGRRQMASMWARQEAEQAAEQQGGGDAA